MPNINQKKNILYIHHTSSFGGATTSLLQILNHLDRTIYDFHLLLLSSGPLEAYAREKGWKVSVEPRIHVFKHVNGGSYSSLFELLKGFGQLPFSIFRTWKILKSLKPDFVHLNSAVLLGPALGCVFAKMPFVWHVREHFQKGIFGLRRFLILWIMRRFSQKIIAISEGERERLGNPSNSVVIHNSVNLKDFEFSSEDRLNIRSKYDWNEKDFVIASLGLVVPEKGPDVLLEAFLNLKKDFKNLRLLFLGQTFEGPYLERLRQKIKNASAEKDIFFDHAKAEVGKYYSAFDLIVFPVVSEHSSRTLIEAAAAGLPAIASDFPCNRAILKERETGTLFPPGNSQILTERLREVFEQEPLRKKWAGNAKKNGELFSSEKMIKKLEDCYSKTFSFSAVDHKA